MKVEASLKYYRRSPKKVLETANLIKGKKAVEAVLQLENLRRGDSDELAKLIQSAMANAENNFSLDKNNLLIEEIRVQKGPVLKRWRARAYGRGAQILKRTCHLTVILNEIEEGKKIAKKADKEAGKKKQDGKGKEENKPKEEKTEEGKVEKKGKFFKDEEKRTSKSDWSNKKMFRRKSV